MKTGRVQQTAGLAAGSIVASRLGPANERIHGCRTPRVLGLGLLRGRAQSHGTPIFGMPPWCQEDWPLTQSPSLYDRPSLWRPQGADTRFEPSPLPTSETWDLQTWVDSFAGVSLSQKPSSEFLNVRRDRLGCHPLGHSIADCRRCRTRPSTQIDASRHLYASTGSEPHLRRVVLPGVDWTEVEGPQSLDHQVDLVRRRRGGRCGTLVAAARAVECPTQHGSCPWLND
jgi:hypothetical protein